MGPADTTRLICSMTAPDPRAMREDMRAAAGRGANMVELRLDLLAEPPTKEVLAELLRDAPLPIIATCRPVRQGGRFAGDERLRLAILKQAAKLGAALADIEDDVPAHDWPAARVILSHHDFAGVPRNLEALARRLDASGATVVKIAFVAAGPEDAVRALDLLRSLRKPAIAIAMGEAGALSRIAARKFGAFGTFASLDRGAESAPGQPTLAEFRELYRWEAAGPATELYGVIGHPISHSMSPAIHNAALSATGRDGVYVPLMVSPGAEAFNRFLDAVRARPWLDWRGLSVTIPHKENALAYVGAENCDELTRRIGAANTIAFLPDGTLRGTNTDYAAAIDSLCSAMGVERRELAGRRVAVLGAGGAARAIVAALAHYRGNLTIYNRTFARAEALAREFACRAEPLDHAEQSDAEIIINCTPIGMHPRVDDCPLERIPPSARVVFDTIYNPVETELLRRAKQAGCRVVTGVDMFVNQAVAQFETWTGHAAPRQVMRDVVLHRLSQA